MKEHLFRLVGSVIIFFIQIWAWNWAFNLRRLIDGREGWIQTDIPRALWVETVLFILSGVILGFLLSLNSSRKTEKLSLIIQAALLGVVPLAGIVLKFLLVLKLLVIPLRYLSLIEWSLTPVPSIWFGLVLGLTVSNGWLTRAKGSGLV